MASHGKKRHMKRLARPKSMPISPKTHTYLKKMSAGPHPKNYSLPLSVYLVEIAKVAKNMKEVKVLLRDGSITIDGRKTRDPGFPIGIMDIISIPILGKYFRVSISHGKIMFKEIEGNASKHKLCKITSKTQLGKDKVQLNLHDGRNVIVTDGKKYATGGTLSIEIPAQEIKAYLPLSKGSKCFVYKGVHSGQVAALKELTEREASTATDATLTGSDGKEFITRKDYLFVVEENFTN